MLKLIILTTVVHDRRVLGCLEGLNSCSLSLVPMFSEVSLRNAQATVCQAAVLPSFW